MSAALSPLDVLRRARERVATGTHATAHLAIDRTTAAEAQAGDPNFRAWCLLLKTFGEPHLTEGVYRAAEDYYAISFYDSKPDRDGELQALDRAIALAEAVTEINDAST